MENDDKRVYHAGHWYIREDLVPKNMLELLHRKFADRKRAILNDDKIKDESKL